MDFHNTHHIKSSKKPHRCKCTGVVIPIGSPYVRYSGVYEGDFYSICVHAAVHPIYEKRNNLAWKAGDEGLCPGDLIEDIIENNIIDEATQLQDAEVIYAITPNKNLEELILTIKKSTTKHHEIT